MDKCLQCQKELNQIPAKRKKEFCNSSCRSKYWHKRNRSTPEITNLNKTTNEKKPIEQEKANYSINTKSDLSKEELERQLKEWQNKKCPSYMDISVFKKMQEKEIKELQSQLKLK